MEYWDYSTLAEGHGLQIRVFPRIVDDPASEVYFQYSTLATGYRKYSGFCAG